jgi:hypothetical protein
MHRLTIPLVLAFSLFNASVFLSELNAEPPTYTSEHALDRKGSTDRMSPAERRANYRRVYQERVAAGSAFM